jgi:hypothetical protein
MGPEGNTGGSVTTQPPDRCSFCVADPRYRHRGLAVATGRAQTERNAAPSRRSGRSFKPSDLHGCGDASSDERWRRFLASTLLSATAGPDRRGGCAYGSRRRFREWCQPSWLAPRRPYLGLGLSKVGRCRVQALLGRVFCLFPIRADAATKIPTLVAKDATRMGHHRLSILRSNQRPYCTTRTICWVRVAVPEVAVTVRL